MRWSLLNNVWLFIFFFTQKQNKWIENCINFSLFFFLFFHSEIIDFENTILRLIETKIPFYWQKWICMVVHSCAFTVRRACTGIRLFFFFNVWYVYVPRASNSIIHTWRREASNWINWNTWTACQRALNRFAATVVMPMTVHSCAYIIFNKFVCLTVVWLTIYIQLLNFEHAYTLKWEGELVDDGSMVSIHKTGELYCLSISNREFDWL